MPWDWQLADRPAGWKVWGVDRDTVDILLGDGDKLSQEWLGYEIADGFAVIINGRCFGRAKRIRNLTLSEGSRVGFCGPVGTVTVGDGKPRECVRLPAASVRLYKITGPLTVHALHGDFS